MGASSQHFTDAELACKGTTCGPDGRGCHQNNCTVVLVASLETFRERAAKLWTAKHARPATVFPGVRIHDAYRCLKHNAQTTGAAADSQHPNGRAADFSVDGLTAVELEAIANTIPAFRGIGRDDLRNMIHGDTRPQPTNAPIARWCYYRDETGKIRWGAYMKPAGPAPLIVA